MEQQPSESPQQPSPAQSPQPEQPQPSYYPPAQPPAYGTPPYGPPAGTSGYPPQPYGPPPGYPMPPASTPPGYYGMPPTGAPGYPPQPYGQQPPMPGAPYPYPYQQPPFPAPMPAPSTGPSRGLIWALVSLGVVIVVVLAVVVVTLNGHKNTPSNLGSAAATSTVTAKNTYSAPIPGPGCDTHGGVWKADFDAQTSCLSSGLHITTTTVGDVIFSGPSASSTFPLNYEVSVDVTPFDSLDAGMVVHQTAASNNGYEFGIDKTGSWSVYNRNGSAHSNLPYGSVGAATQYHLDVMVKGSAQTLSIDGAQVKQFTDTEFTGGDSIGLIVYAGGSNSGQADFKNFVFKTLP